MQIIKPILQMTGIISATAIFCSWYHHNFYYKVDPKDRDKLAKWITRKFNIK